MSQYDFSTALIIATSILVWMAGLYVFDTLRRQRRAKREAWKKDSERRWN